MALTLLGPNIPDPTKAAFLTGVKVLGKEVRVELKKMELQINGYKDSKVHFDL